MCCDPSASSSSSAGKSTEHLKSWTKVSQRWTCAGNVPTEVRRFTMYWGQCVDTCAAALCGIFNELHLWQVVMKCKPRLENHCITPSPPTTWFKYRHEWCFLLYVMHITVNNHIICIFTCIRYFLSENGNETQNILFLVLFDKILSRTNTHTHTHADAQRQSYQIRGSSLTAPQLKLWILLRRTWGTTYFTCC